MHLRLATPGRPLPWPKIVSSGHKHIQSVVFLHVARICEQKACHCFVVRRRKGPSPGWRCFCTLPTNEACLTLGLYVIQCPLLKIQVHSVALLHINLPPHCRPWPCRARRGCHRKPSYWCQNGYGAAYSLPPHRAKQLLCLLRRVHDNIQQLQFHRYVFACRTSRKNDPSFRGLVWLSVRDLIVVIYLLMNCSLHKTMAERKGRSLACRC